EVDTMPPLEFETEQKILLLPRSFMTRCFTLPNLFAGKMHALVFRNWKNRVKGRDWYDFEWYVRNRIPLNFAHLQRRILEFNDEMLTRNDFIALLKDKINNTSIEQVKADVLPFLRSEGDLKLWSNEYFLALSDMILFS
ncbi:MAG: nucleotidyl transferase AbiEii/AbiGii toxin family protein, partial [Muribaculaceae bacterium]